MATRVINPTVEEKYEIISKNTKFHLPGIGDVNLKRINLHTADRIYGKFKGILRLKEQPEKKEKWIPDLVGKKVEKADSKLASKEASK